ncbi:MAG TPA: rhodanese-like domain-containing protein [Alphaproteobacteria bacterium]|nr:rhodanese-like domain-containing protein [Alphaproteobacteria bacterium]USO05523.1 MAG: rhodanese-like domain-containing protein [Rhodospirillales bacterium]HOO82787.1 rhodanese-like domain-containing protein [Alphaproteobacteria bacterium]
MSEIPIVGVQQAHEWLQNGEAVIFDVRDQGEYDEEHIPGAVLNPLSMFSVQNVEQICQNRKIIFQCKSGKRAQMALERYMKEGPCARGENHLFCLEGSLPGWKAAGLPTEKGRKVISLERQVMSVFLENNGNTLKQNTINKSKG